MSLSCIKSHMTATENEPYEINSNAFWGFNENMMSFSYLQRTRCALGEGCALTFGLRARVRPRDGKLFFCVFLQELKCKARRGFVQEKTL